MKVLLLTPYPLKSAPSQRFRFEQYLAFLKANNINIQISSFINGETWKVIYLQGHYVQKAVGIVFGFLRRWIDLFKAINVDFVFIHREASPIGPPIFEFIIGKILRKKIIYDFDDAIWMTNTSQANKIVSGLKWAHKVNAICSWAYVVSCGNAFLANYAQQFNNNVVVIPTTIDTVHLHNKVITYNRNEKLVIGWTGTHSTIQYLNFVVPILEKLEERYDFVFRVISNKNPNINLKSFEFLPWNKESEIDDLYSFDIGIMPLKEDKWSKGKCGFKALQYMSLGIPCIISPVGVNEYFGNKSEGVLLVQNKVDWEKALSHLLSASPEERATMGTENLQLLQKEYSVLANQEKYLNLFTLA